ncbi:MAG: ABC transporter permease, partial [Fuerstiella sp.]|nr:ABC transporter permease [Fuerstiella sp.]
MKKNLGILGILLVVFMATAMGSSSFFTAYNLFNLVERSSLYGIIGI